MTKQWEQIGADPSQLVKNDTNQFDFGCRLSKVDMLFPTVTRLWLLKIVDWIRVSDRKNQ